MHPPQTRTYKRFETHIYKRAAGCDIRADVRRAPETAGPAPVVVLIHGGALIAGSRGGVNSRLVDLCLAAGQVVVSIDYRLAPETKLPEIVEDVRDALQWVRTAGPGLFGADPRRIAVVGNSAGGYLALVAGTFEPRPAAVVSLYGYGDILADWYARPDPFYRRQTPVTREQALAAVETAPICEGGDGRAPFYLYCRQQGLWPKEVGGRDPEAEPDFFRPYCPARNVTPDYPPTLLLHGRADTDVPCEQSEQMAAALAAAGVRHRLITFPNTGHAFDYGDTPTTRTALDAIAAFVAEHLAPESP